MTDLPQVVILGAGPAGLGAAYRVAREGKADALVLEREDRVGGNAASFDLHGFRVDFGSHRLHPACDPDILSDIRGFLGDDLLDRPRHGRIRLRGRWLHFPLKPANLVTRLSPTFGLGVVRDTVAGPFRRGKADTDESFATVLTARLGPTVAESFYLPYARKIWGREPEELSAIQARKRVSADSPLKLVRKVLGAVPGLKRPGAGRFFYPRRGFGAISEAYRDQALQAGATIRLGAEVRGVELEDGAVRSVVYRENGTEHRVAADHVWSTIPLNLLARGVRPSPPAEVLEAGAGLEYRSMLLIYLVLDQERFTEYDAHYFPEEDVQITRISEARNYGMDVAPEGQTVLCAELPCDQGDAVWTASDQELGDLVRESLARAALPVEASVAQIGVRRLTHAYPIYARGYDERLDRLDAWASEVRNLLTLGRQGLFAHDNTHHTLYMAYAAADCLGDGGHFDHEKWKRYREEFTSHVVED